jgi:hypothetical protein
MRKIAVALTTATLALSMLAQAIPAAAAAGYDSSYAGESAFVSLAPGQSNEFQVFFANTGTTTWTVGSSTEVDLAACLADKVTCNAQDATEAPWNSGWKSATRYATSTQTSVAPGSIATFKYTVAAPSGAAAGTYDFNGDLVVATTGEKVHPEGYFQSATVGTGSGAAVITSLTPSTGTASGGTSVAIAGSGFVCTPAFPSVTFGANTAAVTSCGTTALTATSPAGAVGSANVAVTNSGAASSNTLPFVYADTTKPTFMSFTITGAVLTVTFSEPVCRILAFAASDWTVNNVSSTTADAATGDSIPICTAAKDNAVTTAIVTVATALPNGSFVETTLNAIPAVGGTTNTSIVDTSANPANAPQARQSTAAASSASAPALASASGAVGATVLKLTFSQPVYCTGFVPAGNITLNDNNAATSDPTVTGFGTTPCPTTILTASTTFNVNLSAALPSATTYVVTMTPAAGTITNQYAQSLPNPSTTTFTTGQADFTPPTLTDARMANNVGTTDFTEIGDSFTLTFSEPMINPTAGATIQAQDQDGTVFSPVLTCGGNVSCTWNTAGTTVTITATAALTTPTPLGTAGSGSTPGMQIPFNITTLNGFSDLAGNVPNVLGSSDRLVDYE